MKLGLATGVLSSTPPPAPLLCMLRVDRVFDRIEQPRFPDDDIPDTSYRVEPATDRWEVRIDGAELVLFDAKNAKTLRGTESSNVFGERRFAIANGGTTGGRFVVRGEDAELTLFGSGVPVVSSERGKLVSR